jgi:hypothetical protein
VLALGVESDQEKRGDELATANKMIGYRPDPIERAILEAYKKKTGLPYARLIALAVREKAEREGVVGEVEAKQQAQDEGVKA